jgi:serine/threonine-protein phosphatase 6 regulatory ankyrin repeat subunit B
VCQSEPFINTEQYLEIIKLLLDKKADINSATQNGQTPLKIARNSQNPELIQIFEDQSAYNDLITETKNVADINLVDMWGKTPLIQAVIKGYPKTVKLLLEKRADVNLVDKTGITPLIWAVIKGDSKIAELLLDNGASVNLANSHKMTPLSIATNKGDLKIVTILLDNKADINSATQNGQTPLKIARNSQNPELIQIFEEQVASNNLSEKREDKEERDNKEENSAEGFPSLTSDEDKDEEAPNLILSNVAAKTLVPENEGPTK